MSSFKKRNSVINPGGVYIINLSTAKVIDDEVIQK